MKKFLFPVLASLLLLAGASTSLMSCKDAAADAIQLQLDRQNKYKVIDDSVIRAYLTRHQYGPGDYTRTDAGLYLVKLTSNPQGAPAVSGKQVAIKYIGKLINKDREDITFDTSFNNQTLCDCRPFTVGGQIIPGWNQGLPLMRQGERTLLFVPSYLAYGPAGAGQGSIIGPDTPLMFDMEIVAVSQ